MKQVKKKQKDFIVHIQFHAHEVRVRATTAAEAKKKAALKLSSKSLTSLLDRKNCSADEL